MRPGPGQSAQGKTNVPPSLFQANGKRGGTLTLPLASSPQSFNYFAVLDNTSPGTQCAGLLYPTPGPERSVCCEACRSRMETCCSPTIS
ncbi:hypothetical protein GCM10010840_17000 [Deinococcus aerolatus]|uniref:Uncharacterized protein n=1 Tax=Deinococcus aerolatus TaxID=522487 RepID=A0ABQ2G7S0_9DEIO|nr:hypothetical protein GCM10010840_17000 [Deinococcus aerolatus]